MFRPLDDLRNRGRQVLPSVSRTDAVYIRTRSDIVTGLLRPGERLRVLALRDEHGVSLSTVREALTRLSGERLVRLDPQRGFRVAAPTPAELTDIAATPRTIERLALRRSLERGDVAWEARLLAAHHRLAATALRDPDYPDRVNAAFAAAHIAFRTILIEACDSDSLLELWQRLHDMLEPYRLRSYDSRRTTECYRAVLEAAMARDADGAADLLQRCEPALG